MKLFAPSYYKNFVCIADACRHSCCIGWEIDIDEDTKKKYEGITDPYGEVIRQSIEEGDTPHFSLGEHERCPHLDEKGLCRIISCLGNGYLCDICREHPRFYHETAHGIEVGIGMSCEEACRLILTSDGYAQLEEIEDAEVRPLPDFDVLPLRSAAYAILASPLSLEERLSALSSHFSVSCDILTDEEWRNVLAALEYLHREHRALFACYTGAPIALPKQTEAMLTRALAYFIFRHASKATDEGELCAAIGFSLFCTRLLASLVKSGGDLFEHARTLSEELEYSEDNTDAIMQEFFFSF